MAILNAAITQMASENDWARNCDKAERLVREAAAKGAQLVLLQELLQVLLQVLQPALLQVPP